MQNHTIVLILIAVVATLSFGGHEAKAQSQGQSSQWKREWSRTDFSKSAVDFSDIMSGGPAKDGIPAIDDPQFMPVMSVQDIGEEEPVIVLAHNNVSKAYPLRILIWHEIANDVVGGMPVTITYCPLCNASIVFDRRLDGRVLDFGVSGKLRHSDMIMYDRQTESWWQQFSGLGIVGEMTGKKLKKIPSRVMPFSVFKKNYPDGVVLVPQNPSARRYGMTPYTGYDKSRRPFLYRGHYKGPVPALAYVVAVDQEAWPLSALREKQEIRHKGLILRWHEGMNSALDQSRIDRGRDVGFVTVQRQMSDGTLQDEVYDMTFAFAFMEFEPEGVIYMSAE